MGQSRKVGDSHSFPAYSVSREQLSLEVAQTDLVAWIYGPPGNLMPTSYLNVPCLPLLTLWSSSTGHMNKAIELQENYRTSLQGLQVCRSQFTQTRPSLDGIR